MYIPFVVIVRANCLLRDRGEPLAAEGDRAQCKYGGAYPSRTDILGSKFQCPTIERTPYIVGRIYRLPRLKEKRKERNDMKNAVWWETWDSNPYYMVFETTLSAVGVLSQKIFLSFFCINIITQFRQKIKFRFGRNLHFIPPTKLQVRTRHYRKFVWWYILVSWLLFQYY